jgi:pSer/pThr/pTyr-binding forkhead associated (FHA) protein
VSRKHALLSFANAELVLQDYGSANGTYLNGVRLPAHRSHKISDGDEIRLGHLSMRVYFIIS